VFLEAYNDFKVKCHPILYSQAKHLTAWCWKCWVSQRVSRDSL